MRLKKKDYDTHMMFRNVGHLKLCLSSFTQLYLTTVKGENEPNCENKIKLES